MAAVSPPQNENCSRFILIQMRKFEEPWRQLPRELADVLEPELPALTAEIMQAIGNEVPEYARQLDGGFGAAVRTGVDEALHRFVALIRDPDSAEGASRQVYVALGRGEHRVGRTLDSLQAAYRVGARVAWRRCARAGERAGLDQPTVARLAEAIFAYIDELSADSVEGYAQAQSEVAGVQERRREELVAALTSGTMLAELPFMAKAVGWRIPRSAAAVAVPAERLASFLRRVGPDALGAPCEGFGCVLIPDAAGPGRVDTLKLAAAGLAAGLGPDVPVAGLPGSWRLARATLEITGSDGLAVADESLGALLVSEAAPVIERMAARRLAPFAELTPNARRRMSATALAYVQLGGNAVAMAEALNLHPQTARYRIARLRELLGEQLLDPDARFELELALRAAAPRPPAGG
jgi:PucR C-terminal helix-turn-helix domain